MTELKYVKACTGPFNPINDEFVWGSTNIKTANYTYSNLDELNESINNLLGNNGNTNYLSNNVTTSEPKRNGNFAASSSNHTRQESGETYYGIMEMSGNVFEPVVKIFNGDGRNFSGLHGDCELTTDGQNNVNTWKSIGISVLGGSFGNTQDRLTLSSRELINFSVNQAFSDIGLRGVRAVF